MPVNIACPNCQKALQLQETLMGKRVRCPACKEVFTAALPEDHIQAADEIEGVQERPSRPARPRRPAPPPEEDEDYEDEDEDVRRGRPHRGGTVLTMGILTLVFALCCPLVCWVLGGIGLSMANADLRLMASRKMDRSGQGTTNTGKILAIVGLVLGTLNAILGILIRVSGVLR